MFLAPLEARNMAIAAMSSGSFARFKGILSVISLTMASTEMPLASARVLTRPSTISVVVTPGQIELTVISCLANC